MHFGLQLSGSVDITGDSQTETGVTVALGYPATTPSATITLTPVKGIGEIAAANNPAGGAGDIKNTMLTTVGHAISFDDETQAVLYADSKGFWKAGNFGDPVNTYLFLTWDHDENPATPTEKINNDTFEVTAIHLQAIKEGAVVQGYELVAEANENPDDIFVLYFNANGELVSSEYLSEQEALLAEDEYDFDVNSSGALGAVDTFLAEGARLDNRDAPDLYADEFGDLVLVFANAPQIKVTLDGEAVNLYDFEDGIEPVIVVPGPSSNTYLVYFQFSDDDVAAVTVSATGAIATTDGEIVFTELTAAIEALIERSTGIDVARDGDTAALSPLITGDAGDNTFDSRGDGTHDRYKDSTGDDTYFGGEGDDLLMGILAGEANFASRGSNVFYGGEGNDRYAGMADGDIFLAGSGSDAVWINGASTAFDLFRATPEQLALAQAFDDSVSTGYVVREKASGSLIAAFDAESVEFALDGVIKLLNDDLVSHYTPIG